MGIELIVKSDVPMRTKSVRHSAMNCFTQGDLGDTNRRVQVGGNMTVKNIQLDCLPFSPGGGTKAAQSLRR
ncbi:hypothetical protein D9V34_12090 [Mycetocola lacteus]|uniref:Uncharacterized protein n=1 Tax=Mycetocola lacteus TaxID=76637 RepID=A0A3L7AP06_9MICO|nr:hypothetical protein D9V34_12090 [Mycetocola lacteus]